MSREWVENATRVQAVYGFGDGVHAEGVVFAYTDQPTVMIRTDDGRTVSWVASLCREHPATDRRVGGSSLFPPAVLLVPQNGCRVCGEEAPAGFSDVINAVRVPNHEVGSVEVDITPCLCAWPDLDCPKHQNGGQ